MSYRRGAGFGGPLPITYSDINAYCSLRGIYMAGEKEQLVRYLDILDHAFMSENYERAQEAAGAPPTNPKNRNRTDVPRASKRAPTKEVTPR